MEKEKKKPGGRLRKPSLVLGMRLLHWNSIAFKIVGEYRDEILMGASTEVLPSNMGYLKLKNRGRN